MSSQFYWYGTVKKLLYMYPKELKKEGTIIAGLAESAIRNSIDYTLMHYRDGDERIKFIETVYFRQTTPFIQTAMEMYICQRTAEKWNQDFIYLVAEKMGFKNAD